ncbi:filamentous hemagglutinin N-terminal domain-containing protein [Chitinimonas arctica]|uniref:Filamentous hemagglutinin N-terminal domain-containing protein n=1 Tax=Chitinimonas arctica TaxID=2594795 RepID=A0A516SII3_9NEIS|nr:YDG domain-containing protein [Chitinimonas arctica]QDQ27956.1 filamentous hemagglutinin N-terminal domain-containing protein [Chitinimonas arctica]
MSNMRQPRFVLNSLVLATLACYCPTALANPAGATVVSGSASVQQQGNQLLIANTPGAIINWSSFSIGQGELTRFVQQGGDSAVLNRVIGQDASQILGQLQSNGRVFLINPNGIVFGQGAQVDTAGLVASTLNISDQDFQSGRLRFQGGEGGSIRNAAHLNTSQGGFVYLIAPAIENSGVIVSPQGEIVLAAGHSVELVDGVDTSLRVKLSADRGEAVNVGQLIAEQGRIGIFAAAIRQQGVAIANRAERGAGGQIVFKAGSDITLAAGSQTRAQGGEVKVDAGRRLQVDGDVDVSNQSGKGGLASLLGNDVSVDALIDASGRDGGGSILVGGDFHGANPAVRNAQFTALGEKARLNADAGGRGDGGTAVVWADQRTHALGKVSARGGALGGNGGNVEISGKQQLSFQADVDTRAAKGKVGHLLLDPANWTVCANVGPGCDQDVGFITGATTNVTLSVANHLIFDSSVGTQSLAYDMTLESTVGDVKLNPSVSLTSGGVMKLIAFNQILLDNASLSGSQVELHAGSGGISQTGTINSSVVKLTTAGGDASLSGLTSGSGSVSLDATLTGSGNTLSVDSGVTLMLAGLSWNGTANLTVANGGISQSVPITVQRLNAMTSGTSGAATDISLGIGSNQIDELQAQIDCSGGGCSRYINVGSSSALQIAGTGVTNNTSGSAILTGSGGIFLNDAQVAAPSVTLLAPGNALTSTGTSGVVRGNNIYLQNNGEGGYTGSVGTEASPFKIASWTGTASQLYLSFGGGGLSSVDLVSSHDIQLYTLELSANARLFLQSAMAVDTYNIASINTGTSDLTLKSLGGLLTLSPSANLSGHNVTLGSGATTPFTTGSLVLTATDIAKLVTGGTLDISAASAISGVNGVLFGAGGDATLQSAVSSSAGNVILATSGNFHRMGAGALVPGGGGHYEIWSTNPTLDTLNGLIPDFKQYNAIAGTSTVLGSGNGLLYSVAPTVTVGLGGSTSKGYDGTTAISTTGITYTATPDIALGDIFTPTGTSASLADKNAGSGKSVTVSGIAVTAKDGNNVPILGYQLASTSAMGNVGMVNPASLSVSTGNVSKVYDAGISAAGTAVVTAGTVYAGDSVSGGTFAFADKNVGSGNKTVHVSGVTVGDGVNNANYTVSYVDNLTSTISPLSVSLSGVLANDKTYDGNTTATISSFGSLSGVLGGDTVGISGGTGNFIDKNVGTNKAATIIGLTLTGADAGNYLFNPAVSTTAQITQKHLALSGTVIDNKVYDGSDMANVSSLGSLTGIVGADVVSGSGGSASFADKHAGLAKPVTLSGVTLSGTDSGNYKILAAVVGNADITPKSLTLSGVAVSDKVYDGTNVAAISSLGSLSGIIVEDDVSSSGGTATFIDKHVGTGKSISVSGLTLSGMDAGNYTFAGSVSTSAAITPLTVQLNGLSVANKVYDGTTVALLGNPGSLSGTIAGDDVSAGGLDAKFGDKNVGAGKAVTVSGVILSGADAGNYLVTLPSGFSANITPATLTLGGSAGGNTKTYDGNTLATLSNFGTLEGLVAGDAVNVTGKGEYADRHVGIGKAITVTQLALAGQDAGNYTLGTSSLQASGEILRLASVNWVGGNSGSWGEAANWTGGAIPDRQNVAAVVLPVGVTVSYDATLQGDTKLEQLSGGGNVAMSGGQLAVASSANVGGWQQSGGSFSAAALTVANSFQQTGGSIALSGGKLDANQSSGGMLVGEITAGQISLTSQGDILSGIGTGNTLRADTASLTAGGRVGLPSTSLNKLQVAAVGNVDLVNSLALSVLSASSSSGNIKIEANGGLTTVDTVVAAGTIELITHSPMQIGSGGIQAGQGIALRSGENTGDDDITLNGNLQSTTGGCDITAGGSIAQNGNIGLGGNGNVNLKALTGGLTMANGAATSTNGGGIAYQAVGDVVLGYLDAGTGSVAVSASQGGVLSAAAGLTNVRGGQLNVNAGGKIELGADVPAGQLKLTSAIGNSVVRDRNGVILSNDGGVPVSTDQAQTQTITGLSNVGTQINDAAEVKDDQQQKIDQQSDTKQKTDSQSDDKANGSSDEKRRKAKKC